MKKVFSIVAGLALVASLASCKKDYTCSCKDSEGEEWEKVDLGKTTKKKAKDACEATNATWAAFGAKCEVK